MKRFFVFIIFFSLILVSCSHKDVNTISLSDNCNLNYVLDNNNVVSIEITQSDKHFILYFPEINEMQFSLSDSDKKCNAILSDEFYALEISNGLDNTCTINKGISRNSQEKRNVVQFQA